MRYDFTFLAIFWCFVSFVSAKNGGFSANLYHRDGPGTPFYDPTLSTFDRFNRSINRDFARASKSLVVTPNFPIAELYQRQGLYLMKLAIGTPPYEFFAFADTGSEQNWLQCTPCEQCFQQNQPLFNPEHSSTYKSVECLEGRIPCPDFRGVTCVVNVCRHHAAYGDASFSKGVLSTDTLTMQSTTNIPVTLPNYIFGCGTNNQGLFAPEAAGIVGLGHGPRSLITQLGTLTNGKFSYCLFPDIIGGKINFGEEALVSGPDVITTRIFSRPGNAYNPFYFTTLRALTVGNERVVYNHRPRPEAPGIIIIDSGATLTYLPRYFHDKVVAAVERQINIRPVQSPHSLLKLCFRDSISFKSPRIIAHFDGGDLVLNEFNMFHRVAPGVMCLTITVGSKPLWGNIAQLNFLVGFDVVAGTVSFKPSECQAISP